MFKTKGFLAMIISVFLFAAVSVSYAQSSIYNITAQINSNLKIALNGNSFITKDAKGTILNIISYKGTIYLPVKSIGEACGLAVDYNSNTQTIILGERAGKGLSLFDMAYDTINQHIYITKDPKILTYNKNSYKIGMFSKYNSGGNIEFINLNKRFQTLTFKAWVIGPKSLDLDIFAEKYSGIKLRSMTLNQNDGLIDINVNIQGLSTLCFKAETDGSKLYIVDAYLK